MVCIIAVFSGFSGLVFELVWSRYLSLLFGTSVYAVAAVLACYMMGTACGSIYFGKLADRFELRRMLMWLETGIGIYGLLSPILFAILFRLNQQLFQHIYLIDYLKNPVRFVLAFIILFCPTFLMGGLFPTLVKMYQSSSKTEIRATGQDVSLVNALNTLGGAVGAFLTGFFLIKTCGMRTSIIVASILSLAAAGLILFTYRNPDTIKFKTKTNRERQAPPSPEPVYPKYLVITIFVVFAVSGFSCLGYEVLWTKVLALFFGDSIYDLAIVLTAFLGGIVIGSYLCGRLILKRRNSLFLFALAEILIGIVSIFTLYWIGRLPYLTASLQSISSLYQKFGGYYWILATIIRFGFAFMALLIPTTLFGTTFPLASQVCAVDSLSVGGKLGMLNGINTFGAALGSLTAGFVFIGWLGIQKSITFVALINIAAGLLIMFFAPARRKGMKWAAPSMALLVSILAVIWIPHWDKLRMSTNIVIPDQTVAQTLSLQYYREDAYGVTSVALLKQLNFKVLTTNRLYSQNTSAMMGLEDHRRLGHIPLMLHAEPQNVLVIGLGAGITLRGVCEHPEVKKVDCVEISESVIQAARFFKEENHQVLSNPKVHVIAEDGRNFLSITPNYYDVIIGDILFPMSSGASNMASREYFELCKGRLKPGGLYCQWLPVHQLSLDEIKTIVGTFQTVFPHTSLWYGMIGSSTPVIGCIGTGEKLAIDYQSLKRKFQDPVLVKSMLESNLDDPCILLSNFIMEGNSVNIFAGDQPLNTDDRPVIEFASPRLSDSPKERGVKNLAVFSEYVEDVSGYIGNLDPKQDDVEFIRKKISACLYEVKGIIRGL